MPRSSKTAESAPSYTTATLAKGLDVLSALGARDDAGLSELARELGLSAPTLFRILATLVERGFVQKTAGRYRLSLRCWELGARALGRLGVAAVARPWMARLAEEVNESPHLAVLQDDAVVIIERSECRQPVKVQTNLGQRAPAHASATGKVLLAFASPDRQAAVLAAPLERFTDRTLATASALSREFGQVRRQGFATNRGEWRPGVSAVAVPLLDSQGAAVASLSLTLPTERFTDARLAGELLPALRRAAMAIAGEMGAPLDAPAVSRPSR